VHERLRSVVAQGLEVSRGEVLQHKVTYARDRSFEREAVTDERELYRDALRRGMSETTFPEIRAGFEARIASGEFRLVPGHKHDTGRQFTTAETIRAETEILRRMQQGQGQAEQIMSIQAAVGHTQKQQHLNPGQRAAAEEILTSRDVVQGLEGRAGVGKTTLLESVREAAEQRGYVVEGFAPTSRAANQLRDAEISADTLQGFLVRASQPNPDRHLYMVDESSLASTKQVRDFLAKLENGDRVLLIGDRHCLFLLLLQSALICSESEGGKFATGGFVVDVEDAVNSQVFRNLDEHRRVIHEDGLRWRRLCKVKRKAKDPHVGLAHLDETRRDKRIRQLVEFKCANPVSIHFTRLIAHDNNL
jgi:ATP-dependent exoDNAse (exonuclease V) alpha subunit